MALEYTKGYNGKIARVNLTTGAITIETPADDLYRTYVGGHGFISYFLFKELPAGCDPLGPENKLIFATGPLTALPLAGSGRHAVGAKSPLTGGYGAGEAGGFWGNELKRAGFDALIVEGVAAKPVYLWIKDGEIEIRDAHHLWGLECKPAEQAVREELGDPRVRFAQIGPAGENKVLYATISNDLNEFVGRGGMGAVMGSKLLKGVAVRGTRLPDVADSKAILAMNKWCATDAKPMYAGLAELGTAGGTLSSSMQGNLPTLNFRFGHWPGRGLPSMHGDAPDQDRAEELPVLTPTEACLTANEHKGAEKITGQAMKDTGLLIDTDGCFACGVQCKRVVASSGRYQIDPDYGGPEYETVGMMGSNCGIDDLEAIGYANMRLGALGMDSISCGGSIGWAMECVEKGLIPREDLQGVDLRFGNVEAWLQMVERIARREGFGARLADGSYRAAQAYGPEAVALAPVVKKQEHPAHEPRVKHGLGLGYMVSPTGADHMHNFQDTGYVKATRPLHPLGITKGLPASDLSPEKVRMVVYTVNWRHFQNSAVYCMFLPYNMEQVTQMVKAATGWNTSLYELMKVGERVNTLSRLFNLREGLTAETDKLARRFLTPFENGPLKGVGVPEKGIMEARRVYYSMMGWDPETGVPTEGKLLELGLAWTQTPSEVAR
ncbi:MAG TPA: aldehyde ferredoxin oxidoreductase family protein [Symbiobacteriaceae bacterium]|jgi:aldehyde:ferredoxin oxidoreductase|nr:aldehyde ferredoxin oxidoreductase family protein [Symbiobacteriaceae bacterium]